MVKHPSYHASLVLCAFIYINFFTNHFIPDFRFILIPLIFVFYFRTWIEFTPRHSTFRMPVVFGFVLTAFFVWIAENIGTFVGAWVYPYQVHAWRAVSLQKISSWFLMVIISFIIVASLKHFKESFAK